MNRLQQLVDARAAAERAKKQADALEKQMGVECNAFFKWIAGDARYGQIMDEVKRGARWDRVAARTGIDESKLRETFELLLEPMAEELIWAAVNSGLLTVQGVTDELFPKESP